MDNKLSELSKPVAWSWIGYPNRKKLTWVQPESWRNSIALSPLYSQEYVSSLDEITQHWIGESAGWKKRAEAAEAFRDQMLKYVRTLGSSAISPSVVETILNAAERSKAGK